MSDGLVIAMAQVNPLVGDVVGNGERVRATRASAGDADLVVFGELVMAGYPPEDLVLRRGFQQRIRSEVERLARETADGGPAILIGAPWVVDDQLYNAALLLDGGTIAAVRCKHLLPNYGVFDEKRVFAAGTLPEPVAFRGARLGIMVCEDMWQPVVAGHLAAGGAGLLVVTNGSPFETDKWGVRRRYAAERVAETGLPLMYVNLCGGQDELVFDGASFVLGSDGELRVQAPSWETGVFPTRWTTGNAAGDLGQRWTCAAGAVVPRAAGLDGIYQAIVTGLRDYVQKNGFPGVVLGLSGGIDSALSAVVAADALGPERVRCVMLPSPFTSPDSLEDAAEVARLLGTRLETISIEPAMAAFDRMLAEAFAGREPGIAEENIQSRARGLTLMALSNKFGDMLLTTGNKSEMSVGYATLYGDMCGGYSGLKDIYKTTVFALARWRNQTHPPGARGPAGRVIPERVISKPPSAELKADQTDQDTLPPYDVLDAVLQGLIEEECSVEDVVARGFNAEVVREIWRMLDRAEYKRRQAPPGVKVTYRAFGRDRRYPITNGFTRLI